MPEAADRLDRIRAEHPDARPDEPPAGTDLGWLLAEVDRLRAQLASGTPEYAVRPIIDGQPGGIEEYGTEREALELRLEQHRSQQDPGYRLVVLTRLVVTTPWVETVP